MEILCFRIRNANTKKLRHNKNSGHYEIVDSTLDFKKNAIR
jgi:hypothetical protein